PCPPSTRDARPSGRSQSRTARSAPALNRVRPSGLNATAWTGPSCPARAATPCVRSARAASSHPSASRSSHSNSGRSGAGQLDAARLPRLLGDAPPQSVVRTLVRGPQETAVQVEGVVALPLPRQEVEQRLPLRLARGEAGGDGDVPPQRPVRLRRQPAERLAR